MTDPLDPKLIRRVVLCVLDEVSEETWRKAWKRQTAKKVDLKNLDAKTHAVIKKLCKRPPQKTTSIKAMQGYSCMQPAIRKALGISANDVSTKQRLQRALVRLINAGKIGRLGETRARVYYLTAKS